MAGTEHSLAGLQRPKRVRLQLPVEVEGEDLAGVAFAEQARSVNVSGGGLCFESRHSLAVGSRLWLRIHLPQNLRRHFGGSEIYEARAVVCRVEPPDASGLQRVGVRFLAEKRR